MLSRAPNTWPKQMQDGGRVAIKRINITRLKRRLKENLELEISIMKRMHHPNIVKLYDTLVSTHALDTIINPPVIVPT
jgi:serine/threonine protein kinase